MRSHSTLKRWQRELRHVIDNNPDPAVTRIAYLMETVVAVAASKNGDYRDFNPVREAMEGAKLLRQELSK